MSNDEFSNIVVLIDAENISFNYLKKVFEIIAAFGEISVRRVYADWTDTSRNAWKPLMHEYTLAPIQQFANKESKNVSDFALVIDAMELLYEGIFDCFCIVSSDSDFTRLAQKIREKGKTVIGLGEKKAIKPFVKACNEFKYLEDENESPDYANMSLDSLMKIALDKLSDSEGWVRMDKIIPYFRQIKPDFTLKDYNISRLGNYFKNNKEYELRQENTFVRRK